MITVVRQPIPVASALPASLVLRRQTRPVVPMGRSLVPTAAAGPDCVVKGIPTVTAVPAGPSLQAVRPLKFRPGQLPRFALVALLPAPVTSARLKPVPIHVFILYVLVQPTVIVRAAR